MTKPGYLPIRLDSLLVDSITDFDLYIWSNHDSAPVLYRARDLAFTEDLRQRLLEHRVKQLYVSLGQESNYYRYIEKNLSQVLADETIDPQEKSHILYDTAQHAVHEIIDNPESPSVLPRSANIVDNVVSYMYGDRESFMHFLKVASFDYSTVTHSVNVFVYCITLAQRLGFTDMEFLQEFGLGALLHDIGKSRVREAVLRKKGALSDAEWSVMRQHPIWGREILQNHGVTSDIILAVTRHHHEKLDGSGYPDGLKDADLPDYVRISTICDIFDALTTQRCYKGALNSFPALRLMQEEMSNELDADFFRSFVEIMADSPRQATTA